MFILNSSLASSSQTIDLKASGIASIAEQAALPTFLVIHRNSDSAAEVVRLVQRLGIATGTILRAQQGSTALNFVEGDTVEISRMAVDDGYVYLGSPGANSTTAIHAAVALTGSAQNINTAINAFDVPRVPTIKGNAGGMAGNVVIHGLDALGQTASVTIALNGAATVAGTSALATVTSFDLPVKTNNGDTVEIGWGAALALPYVISRNSVFMAFANGVREATLPTVTFGSTVGACTVAFNTVPDGTSRSLYLIRE